MRKNNFKRIFSAILIMFVLVGCKNNIEVNTKYNNLKLDVTNIINVGCHEVDNNAYYTHNINDRHTYILDYRNSLEHIRTEHWIGYNIDNNQYVSGDLGQTYDIKDNIFELNYRDYLTQVLKYIETSDKSNISSKDDLTVFTVDFGFNEGNVFEIVKKFGAANVSDKLKSLETVVTLKDKNVVKIVFDITSRTEGGTLDSCYSIEWRLSEFNKIDVKIPSILK